MARWEFEQFDLLGGRKKNRLVSWEVFISIKVFWGVFTENFELSFLIRDLIYIHVQWNIHTSGILMTFYVIYNHYRRKILIYFNNIKQSNL